MKLILGMMFIAAVLVGCQKDLMFNDGELLSVSDNETPNWVSFSNYDDSENLYFIGQDISQTSSDSLAYEKAIDQGVDYFSNEVVELFVDLPIVVTQADKNVYMDTLTGSVIQFFRENAIKEKTYWQEIKSSENGQEITRFYIRTLTSIDKSMVHDHYLTKVSDFVGDSKMISMDYYNALNVLFEKVDSTYLTQKEFGLNYTDGN